MKRIIGAILLCALLLAGCAPQTPVMQRTEQGYKLETNGLEYVPCGIFGVRAYQAGNILAKDGADEFYEILNEEPQNFICDKDLFVYRASNIDEPTLATFNPIAAEVYVEGNASVYITTLYPDNEYLPEDKQGLNPTQDTKIILQIRDALVQNEAVTVPENMISEEDTYFLRLLSADFPGLYYTVIFYSDTTGNYYIKDRASGKNVYAPDDVKLRMVG